MAEETEVIEEEVADEAIEETTEEVSAEDEALAKFTEMVEGVEEPLEEEVEEQEESDEGDEGETAEPQDEPKKETPKVEGLTPAKMVWAIQQGLPTQLVEAARDDAQLEQFVTLAKGVNSEEETAEQEVEFELDLPLEEYPENDPVRVGLEKMKAHFTEQLSSMKSQLQETGKRAQTLEQMTAEQQQAQEAARQDEFDRHLDSLNSPLVGTSDSLSDANFAMRSTVYSYLGNLAAKEPNTPMSELVERVTNEFNLTTNQRSPAEKEAIRKQSKKRLGSGPAKVEPETMSEEQRFAKALKAMGLA